MICPRCSVAEIDGSQCPLCGFSPAASVILQESAIDEVQEVVQQVTAGRFLIQSLLRLGERSLVFLAHEVARDREVALKVIPVRQGVSQALAQKFDREAALYQSLRQAHIVPLYDFGYAATFLWYTLEAVRAQSLADALRERGPLSVELCLGLADQVAVGLDYAHRRDVVHGNLKPSNVFLDDRWVRVSDFAILDAFGRQATPGPPDPWLRLPEYMAPEQFYARSFGASVDQYALAVVVYQCLTGTLPFVGDSFEEVARRQAHEVPSPLADLRKDVPVTVSEAVRRALSKEPAGRFPSVLDFVTALGTAAPPVPRTSVPVRRTTPPGRRATPEQSLLMVNYEPPPPPRRRIVPVLVALGIVAAASLLLRDRMASLWRGDQPATLGEVKLVPSDPGREGLRPPAERPVPSPDAASAAPVAGTTRPPSPTAPVTRPAPLGPAANLLVNATPWGQLLVDGVLIGNTPKANVPLSPGRHLIRITREGYEPFEQEVVVGPGQVVRLTGVVLRPRGP
jgi:serine/threonine-protein kinase